MYELNSVVMLNSPTFLEKMGDRTLREETFVIRNFCEDKVNREILLRILILGSTHLAIHSRADLDIKTYV